MKDEYLTDEQLFELMETVENDGIIKAPQELLDNILLQLESNANNNIVELPDRYDEPAHEEIQKPPRKNLGINNVTEYRLFCMKICVSIVAAVAMVMLIPFYKGFNKGQIPVKPEMNREYYSKEDYLANKDNSVFNIISNLDIVEKTLSFTFENE